MTKPTPPAHFVHPATHWSKVRCSLLTVLWIVSVSLAIGVLGYHALGHLPWVDALLEASMILGGMGPVAPLSNDDVKIFASIYALYSGLALVSTTGLLLAPWVQRMVYHTHVQARLDTDSKPKAK
ncbi:MAG: hypothetical protein ACOYNL_07160 [Rickettsiales bacterium]